VSRVRGARGQAIVWVAILLPTIFLPIVGLSIDAGLLFDARREAQNVADGAARVGAMALDRNYLQRHGKARIDEGEARRDATAYASRLGFPSSRITFPGTRSVAVSVSRPVQPTFLRIVNVGPVTVEASGRAMACEGIRERDACR
jgi:hypothetical protein